MTRKFLLPIDGSDQAQSAENKIIDLGEDGDKVLILNALPDLGGNNIVAQYDPVDFDLKFSQESDEIVQPVAERLRNKGFETEIIQLKGKPGELICETAEEREVDYIVMGRRGKGAASEFVLGSVSRYVIHQTSTPVMVTVTNEQV